MKYNGIIFLFFVFTLFACKNNEGSVTLLADNLPEDKMGYLKTIVGHLSGQYVLANKTYMKSRWSVNERKVAKKYVKELIESLNVEALENNYISPNLNPAIDLILDPFSGTNIYGIIPASNSSKEYVVLGAHYDTGKRNAPGAIDNATGMALIFSVAKQLLKDRVRSKNVIMVFFDQEEEELIGSKAFSKFILEKQWNIHSIHCFDMVGWDEDNDSAMEVFSVSESLINSYETAALEHQTPLKKIIIDPVGHDQHSTDFDAFVSNGFNVVGAGECFYHGDSTPFKDSPDDRFETVDFQYLLSCSNLIETVIRKIVRE